MTDTTGSPETYRAGFACVVGRPNAGKSTFINALVGKKLAITSSKPQTTRHVIRAISTDERRQLVIIDTPGIHRPRTLLGKRLNQLAAASFGDADVVAFCLPANEKIGPGDRYIAEHVAKATRKPVVALVTKADAVDSKANLAAKLAEVQDFGRKYLSLHGRSSEFADIVPLSAINNEQVDVAASVIGSYLPLSRMLYPEEQITDESTDKRMAELIREAALEGLRDELPHSIAVTIEEIAEERSDDEKITRVWALLFVERPSQKAIVLGRKASRLKNIRTRARKEIERLLECRVRLEIHVKVAKEWQQDPKQMDKLGFFTEG